MPIEPPDPGKILDTLRAALRELQALAEARPGHVLPRVAIGGVDVAIVALAELARETKPAA